MDAEQSNDSRAMEECKSYNSCPTYNSVAQTVRNLATASGHHTQKVSETASVKRKHEERMENFGIKIEI